MIEDVLHEILRELRTLNANLTGQKPVETIPAFSAKEVEDPKAALAAAAKAEAEKQDAASKVPYLKEATAKKETAVDVPKPTKENVADAVRAAVALVGKDKVFAAIQKFGHDRATAVPEAEWPLVVKTLKELQ